MWEEFAKYGLVGLLAGAIVILLFFVIKWTLATTKTILDQAAKERECWLQAFNDHTQQAKEFHSQVTEAHKYQRDEHRELANISKEIVLTLGRINGFKTH